MAMIFLGVTACAVCGKLLSAEEAVIGVPPIEDTAHPLYKYFDSGIHVQCFEKWDKKEEILQLIREEKQRFTSSDCYKEMVSKYGRPAWLDE